MIKTKNIFISLAPIMLPVMSIACEPPDMKHCAISSHHSDHNSGVTQVTTSGSSTTTFKDANNVAMMDMHNSMASVKYINNNDVDFMALMIPHHEGAIKMAEIILNTSEDTEIRNLAQGIITEQKNEINIMKHLIEARVK